MDANGTKFHLLLGRDDWARCTIEGSRLAEIWNSSPPRLRPSKLAWNENRAELALARRLFKFVAASGDTRPSIENRRGAGGDAYGNWFWIDQSERKILVRSSGTNTTSDFWPVANTADGGASPSFGDFQPQESIEKFPSQQLRGLAVTEDHYLVIGVIEPAGLLIFDLDSTGAPRQLLWPTAIPFTPFDMAPAPGGGVWVLDREHKCYWGLDRHFNVINPANQETVLDEAETDYFQPVDQSVVRGRSKRSFPSSFSMLASPLELADPIAIEALPDGTVLILDGTPILVEEDVNQPESKRTYSRIYRYRFDQRLDESLSTNILRPLFEIEGGGDFSLEGYDIAFVPKHEAGPEAIEDRLYVASADGNQTFAFSVCLREGQLELRPVVEYFPMRLFGGKGLVTVGPRVYYDFSDQWLPLIKQRRPRYVPEATFETFYFDGRDPDCVWHRLMVDAQIPPETKVEIWSRAANEKSEVALAAWQREPSLYLRSDGSELPFLRTTGIAHPCASNKVGDTWELLFQRARGRYLQLRLRLGGSERNTPRLRALRAYYPRFSYLSNYLPGVYREDEQSASFLDRFLANIEGFYTTLEDKVAAMQVLLDVRSAPADVLDWLAGWLGVALDPAWDEERRRIFIKHAMEFFQYRGTIRGLTMALQLALDPCADESIFETSTAKRRGQNIRIVEKYLTRTTPGVVFGDPSQLSGPRLIQTGERWLPGHGRTNLNQRFFSFMDPGHEPNAPLIPYPITPPDDAANAVKWSEFSTSTLGFVPSMSVNDRLAWRAFLGGRYGSISALNTAHGKSYGSFAEVMLPRDLPSASTPLKDWRDFVFDEAPTRTPIERQRWHDFLARRYQRIKALNDAYNTRWSSFETVALPDKLPADGAPLLDWYQFEAVVAPMHATAHQFVVLLPVPMSMAFKPEEHRQRLALSRRVIDLEKPAHTVFDVKFYWAMFRIGEARLELDTVLDQGSRALQLSPQLVLGQGYLGESYLAPPPLAETNRRFVLGQDPLAKDPRKEKRP